MAIFLSEPPQWTYLTSSLQKCKRKTLLCLYHMLGVNLLQESPKTWSSDPHIWEALPQSHHLTTIKSKARESLPFFCSSCLCWIWLGAFSTLTMKPQYVSDQSLHTYPHGICAISLFSTPERTFGWRSILLLLRWLYYLYPKSSSATEWL